MFPITTNNERHHFFNVHEGCHIPGYTGHCPTLRFNYGISYGRQTKEILQNANKLNKTPIPHNNNSQNYNDVTSPNNNSNEIEYHNDKHDILALHKMPKISTPYYMVGYTGFIPSINYSFGQSYSRAAQKCKQEFQAKQIRVEETERLYSAMRAKSTPKLTSIRNKDDVKHTINSRTTRSEEKKCLRKNMSLENLPIAGYTGYIPKVKGNEASLSHSYNDVVKRSYAMLEDDRQRYQSCRSDINNSVLV